MQDNLSDSGSGGNAGTWSDAGEFVNGPQPGDGFLGMDADNRAGRFNNGRWIQIANSSSLTPATIYDFDFDDDFSLAIWARKTGQNGNDFLFAKEHAGAGNEGYYLIRETGGFGPAGITWKQQAGGSSVATIYDTAGLATFNDGNWHFLVATNAGGGEGARSRR